ncbi:LexA/Signal peptidase [Fomitiporia mediterranea MF3/22]|uniref:LexA/Signal peptidase n=1 Tax=Fomitiporia mediterranea (strain MF3/22) TaxID=694068 RepID=UPI000440870E|nr:LexA/Signal peptidase [Fomitiporia mediterranea MF3/22]EJC98705.1 LexA/Signal peptidase [Fomitiporia mediterranea MF3/22]
MAYGFAFLRSIRNGLKSRKPFGIRLAKAIVAVPIKIGCGYILFTNYVGGPRIVCGPSMLPTFSASEECIIEDALSVRLGYYPRRGELVVLDSPYNPSQQICKRVIGLPGDVVCVDPSGESGEEISSEHVLIPPGHIWIAGDNAAASRDSRTYGPVPIALVRSRVLAKVYPRPWKIFRDKPSILVEE